MIDVFKVKYVVVCGYYGCGGIKVMLSGGVIGLVDKWFDIVCEVLVVY